MSNIIQELKTNLTMSNDDLMKYKRKYLLDEEYEACKTLYFEKGELPQGVHHDVIILPGGEKEDRFYKLVREELSDEEWKEYIAIKQYMAICTIKRCVVFFTVLAVISLIAGIIAGISLADVLS